MSNKHTNFAYAPSDYYRRSDGSWYVPEPTPGKPSHLFDRFMRGLYYTTGMVICVMVTFMLYSLFAL